MLVTATLVAILISQVPHDVAVKAASRIDEARLANTVKRLQSLDPRDSLGRGTRVSGTDGERLAIEFLMSSLAQFGYSPRRQVFDLDQVFEPGRRVGSSNVIVSLGPKDAPTLCLIAHIDSKGANHIEQAKKLGWNWETSATPGADDNASGTAALLEIARVLQGLNLQFKLRIDIVFAGGEEMAVIQPAGGHKDARLGYWMVNIGAEPLVEDYVRTNRKVFGALSVDMLLRPRSYGYSFRVYSDGRWGSQRLATALEHAHWLVVPEATVRMIVRPHFAWSDQGSFWARGWPGVLFIEDDFHHVRYHRVTDFLSDDGFYDAGQLAAGAKIVVAAVVMLSEANYASYPLRWRRSSQSSGR